MIDTKIAGLFKKVYSKDAILAPEPKFVFLKDAAFDNKQKTGDSISVSVELTNEVVADAAAPGETITYSSPSTGVVKFATVSPMELFISTALNSGQLAASAAEGEAAVEKASKNRVKANLKSHFKFLSHIALYGGDANGCGKLASVVIGDKSVTLPASQWSGFFIGMEGLAVEQVNDAAVRTDLGVIVSIDPDTYTITCSKAPIALTAGDHIELKAVPVSKQFMGAAGILQGTGTVLGISTNYSLWKPVVVDNSAKKLTFVRLMKVIARLVAKGLDEDVVVYVGSKAWNNLMTEQAALREIDSSYKPAEVVAGHEGIQFHSQNGKVLVKCDTFLRDGDAMIIPVGSAHRYGAAEVSLRIPGLDGDKSELHVQSESTNSFIFRSYSQQCVFLDKPGLSAFIKNIDPESAD